MDYELEYALKGLNLKSAPGIDRIDYIVISKFSTSIKTLLLEIYNKIFLRKVYPKEWNEFLVFFIPKSEGTKFRPISLASCLCKVFEKMLYNRLSWWFEYSDLLPHSQYGFRRRRSCMDNLAILHSEITLSHDSGKVTSALFLDIQAAYDNVLVLFLSRNSLL